MAHVPKGSDRTARKCHEVAAVAAKKCRDAAAEAAKKRPEEATPVRYGLLGKRLGHSLSPAIHAALGNVPYELVELPTEEACAEWIARAAFDGVNVTIPYKLVAAGAASATSNAVAACGSANTLVRAAAGEGVVAHTTDSDGFLYLLNHVAQAHVGATPQEAFAHGDILVLGAGGAARAVTFALAAAGFAPYVVSRHASDAAAGVTSAAGVLTYEALATYERPVALVVNTTPVGMSPACPQSPLAAPTLEHLKNQGLAAVIDIIYNPATTLLMHTARELGIPAENGLRMLVAQALASSRLFHQAGAPAATILAGANAPAAFSKEEEATIEYLTLELSREAANVFLIGMPGCGKTGAGARLAALTGRPFIDLDEAITQAAGATPAELITTQGEAAFRAIETATLASIAAGTGGIVATGGGVVMREENRLLMEQNGRVVFIDRPLEELSVAGRPLSQAHGVQELAATRMPRYASWASVHLPCTGSAAGDAYALLELLHLPRTGHLALHH